MPSLPATLARCRRRQHLTLPYPDGESWQQAVARVGGFLGDLPMRWAGRRILVIGHVATRVMFGSSPNPAARAAAVAAASAACLLGVVYAGVSAYWGVGGTGLLDTIGGTLEREGRAGNAGLLAVVWISVVVKLIVAVLGVVVVVTPWRLGPRRHQLARRTAWAAALLLVLYGGVLTTVGVLV